MELNQVTADAVSFVAHCQITALQYWMQICRFCTAMLMITCNDSCDSLQGARD